MFLLFSLLNLGACSGAAETPTAPSTQGGPPATAAAETPGVPLEGGKTSVLFVVFDTTRADHLGAYGYPHATSPTIDRLAGEGVRFSQFISNSSWTRPAFTSLLTGRHGREVGIYEERFDHLPDSAVMLSERFAEKGYVTLGANSNANVDAVFGYAQGYTEYVDATAVWKHVKPKEGTGQVQVADNVLLDDALVVNGKVDGLLDRHAEALKSKPYFLKVVYIDPHRPWAPTDEEKSRMRGSKSVDYDAEIRDADDALAALLAGLERRGLMNNTLVVVVSDHGEGLQSHPGLPYAMFHGHTVYDSVIHVPLVLHHPALSQRVVDQLAQSIDLVPTLTDLLGFGVPADVSGSSLAPLVTGSGPVSDLPTEVFVESDFASNYKLAVRTETELYIRNDDARRYRVDGCHEGTKLDEKLKEHLEMLPDEELYPAGGQQVLAQNQAGSNTSRRAALAALLGAWERKVPAQEPDSRVRNDGMTCKDGTFKPSFAAKSGAEPGIDAATRGQLEAMGYLDAGH